MDTKVTLRNPSLTKGLPFTFSTSLRLPETALGTMILPVPSTPDNDIQVTGTVRLSWTDEDGHSCERQQTVTNRDYIVARNNGKVTNNLFGIADRAHAPRNAWMHVTFYVAPKGSLLICPTDRPFHARDVVEPTKPRADYWNRYRKGWNR